MKKLIPTYRVKSEAGKPEGEILIYDTIGEETDWWTGEKTGISATAFVADLNKLEQAHDIIRIKLNTLGGMVDSGLAMFNAVKFSKKEIHMHNDAVAYSFGAVFMQAVPKERRHAKKATMLMVHSAAGYPWGKGRFTAAVAEEHAKELRKYDELIATAMSESVGMTKEEILSKWFDGKDHYFTAEEAKAAGLIHDIEDAPSVEAVKDFKIDAFITSRIAALGGNSEEGLLGKIKNYIDSAISKLQTPNSQSQPLNMDLTKLAAKFASGEAVAITADESKAFKALLEQFKDAKFTQAEVDAAVTAKETALNEKITALTNEKNEVQKKLDMATGVSSTSKDKDVITTDKDVKDDPVTAQAKKIKADAEKNKKKYEFLRN